MGTDDGDDEGEIVGLLEGEDDGPAVGETDGEALGVAVWAHPAPRRDLDSQGNLPASYSAPTKTQSSSNWKSPPGHPR